MAIAHTWNLQSFATEGHEDGVSEADVSGEGGGRYIRGVVLSLALTLSKKIKRRGRDRDKHERQQASDPRLCQSGDLVGLVGKGTRRREQSPITKTQRSFTPNEHFGRRARATTKTESLCFKALPAREMFIPQIVARVGG